MSRLCNSCLHSNLDVAFYCAKCGTKIFSNSSNKDKPKKEENIDKNRGNKTATFRWRIVVFIFLVIALFIFLVINKQKVQSPRNYSISEDVKPIEGEEKNALTNKFSLDVRGIPYDSKIQILNISQPYEKYMMLDKGDYHILVSKKGYKTFDKWITVDKNVYVDANLEQVAIVVNEISKKVQRSEGRVLYAKCAGCHGVDGKTKAFGKSAVIAGQSTADLENKIAGYKAGIISTVGMGMLMKGQVSSYSDDDIKAVSAYISRGMTSIEEITKRKAIKSESANVQSYYSLKFKE